MKKTTLVSDLALKQLEVKIGVYAPMGNIHHGKVIEPGPFAGLNLRQYEVNGQWVCDEPSPSQQAAFGRHLIKMNDGSFLISGFLD